MSSTRGHATCTVPHVGDMEERLLGASDSKHDETFIERYVDGD